MNIMPKRLFRAGACLFALFAMSSVHGSTFQDRFASKAPFDAQALERANELLSRMTLEQKIRLTYGASTLSVGAHPEIGMDDEFTMSGGPNNIRPDMERYGHADDKTVSDDQSTSFPTLVALGATFDRELAEIFGYALGQEGRARGKDMILAPNVNIQRSPLAGRNYENIGGEDPQLTAIMIAPIIRGMQRNNLATTVKHYALNNQEWCRTSVNVEVSERALREIYLPGFESAIKNAGSLGIMNAYNQFRGEFCSHSAYLNHQILRKEWGFPGLVVTDWGGLHDTVKGALGGTDIDMLGARPGLFERELLKAVKEGKVPVSVVDDMARHVLYVLVKIKKFEPETRIKGVRNTREHQLLSRRIAEQAIVLLRNDAKVLPLDPRQTKKILVLGQNAVNEHIPGGFSAAGYALYETTPLEGLQQYFGDRAEIIYAPMEPPAREYPSIDHQYILTSDRSSKVVGIDLKAWKTEYFKSRFEYAKNRNIKPDYVAYASHPAYQEKRDWKKIPTGKIGKNDYVIRWTAEVKAPETGVYMFSVHADDVGKVWIDDQCLIDTSRERNGTLQTAPCALKKGQVYRIAVELVEFGGEAKITFGWNLPDGNYRTLDDIRQLAKRADAVLIFTGNTHVQSSPNCESEFTDRRTILPPRAHNEVIPQLLPLNPKTVVINLSGAAVTFPWEKQADTLVQYWFAGQEGGTALTRVLFGEVNPSGKLPFTVPYKLADVGAHAIPGAWDNVNEVYKEGIYVGYRWFNAKKIRPLFAFGHGLSYTTFSLSAPQVSRKSIRQGESLQVSVNVTNTGKVAGAEVVQFYVHDVEASVDRPDIELKEFARVFLRPGETRRVTVTLYPRDLSFWSESRHGWVAEPGEFVVRIGNASDNLTQQASFTLVD